ncbi:hypothetical protein AVEN_180599-1 [Araneus ventricosus]|uniref:Uncharacterized protein n=1 Tax=Araneus ventricosus TaxID=182803 RepID=A0A4Y2MT66_ARAVE|nr:hypothetical protein AVEN_180599-1 [Araneus ventricosus]
MTPSAHTFPTTITATFPEVFQLGKNLVTLVLHNNAPTVYSKNRFSILRIALRPESRRLPEFDSTKDPQCMWLVACDVHRC